MSLLKNIDVRHLTHKYFFSETLFLHLRYSFQLVYLKLENGCMKKVRILFTLLAVLSVSLIAQEKATVTLQQAIITALEKNLDIIISNNSLEGQKTRVTSSYGTFLPRLTASAGYSGSSTLGTPSSNFGTSASLDASVTVFDGFQNTSSILQAQNNRTSFENNVVRTRQRIVFQTQQNYLQVLRNKSLLSVSEENLIRSRQQLSRIVESNKVGAVAKADLYRQQVQTANDELTVIRAQNAYDNAKTDLQVFLALDALKDYYFEDSAVLNEVDALGKQKATNDFAETQKLFEEAIAARPDFQSALLKKENAGSDVTIARSTYFPSLSARAGYSTGSTTYQPGGVAGGSRSLSYGVTLSLPLFDGFRRESNVQIAQLNLQNEEENVAYAKRQIQSDIKKAMLNLESVRKQAEVTQQNVISAEEDRKIAEERYNLGAGTLLDLLIANSNYVKAVSDKVNASYDYVLAKQQVKFAIGSEKY